MEQVKRSLSYPINQLDSGHIQKINDEVAIEAPLEIRVKKESDPMSRSIAVTMRTPGHDQELALGFLYTEGIIRERGTVIETQQREENSVEIIVDSSTNIDLKNSDRNFYTTSSCGVCGKASIEAIHIPIPIQKTEQLSVNEAIIKSLPEKSRSTQELFTLTGGIHASALFDLEGKLLAIQEDVGRHNALDKLIGEYFLANGLPLNQHILLLSGRASFELVQKAAMAGIQIIVAIGAPSSLAIDMAKEHQLTLIGFLKIDRFNIYSGHERIKIA